MSTAITAGTGTQPVPAVLTSADAEARTVLLEHEVYALLASAGLDVPAHRLVAAPSGVDEALCRALGSEELVVKIVSPDLLHKSDVGGVVCLPQRAGARALGRRVGARLGPRGVAARHASTGR